MELYETLVSYKFALINRFFNTKDKDSSYLKELREKFILVESLIKRINNNDKFKCTAEIKEIEDFMSKTR